MGWQAREWLDKLKKSFQKSRANTRKAVQSGESSVPVEKARLSDVRALVSLGGQLYECDENKDLNKAQDVLEAAEEVHLYAF